MKKACMIVSVWFGQRQPDRAYNSPVGPDEQLEFFRDKFIINAKNVDPGVDMDLILVNSIGVTRKKPPRHGVKKDWMQPCASYNREDHADTAGGEGLTDAQHEGHEYVASLDGEDIFRGKIRVFNRKNTPGKGFDSFAYGFHQVRNDYQFYLFCEDDVVFFRDDYYKMGIETFERNQPDAMCVGYSPLSLSDPKHFGGGLLLSSRDNLKKASSLWSAKYHDEIKNIVTKGWHSREWGDEHTLEQERLPPSEVSFTTAFDLVCPGHDKSHLVIIEGLTDLAINYSQVKGQKEIHGYFELAARNAKPKVLGRLDKYHKDRQRIAKFKKAEPHCYFVGPPQIGSHAERHIERVCAHQIATRESEQ